jgi:hypothetical protein
VLSFIWSQSLWGELIRNKHINKPNAILVCQRCGHRWSYKGHNPFFDIFDKHLEFEFDKEDVDATMTTMTGDPYVHHVPTLMGGRDYDGVYNFYKNHFIGKMPKGF